MCALSRPLAVVLLCAACSSAGPGGEGGGSAAGGGPAGGSGTAGTGAAGGLATAGGAGTAGGASAGLSQTFLDFETNPAPQSAYTPQLFIDSTGKHRVGMSEGGVRYGECTTGCSREAGWTFTYAGAGAHGTTQSAFAVEPNGTAVTVYNSPSGWAFATCSQGCTTEAGWAATPLPTLLKSGFENTGLFTVWGRALAARDGRVALLFGVDVLGSTDPRYGAYLAYCPGSCATEASWKLIKLRSSTRGTEHGEVVLTATGGVRVAYTLRQAVAELHYAECDSDCGDPMKWYDLPLQHSAGPVGLAVTSSGKPRIAFHTGTAFSTGGQLSYLGCDGDCSLSASWSGVVLPGLSNGAEGVALALDSADQPYIAYGALSSLGVIHCAADCLAPSGAWRGGLWDDSETASTDLPALLPACSSTSTPHAGWAAGRLPTVALSGGRLAVAYGARVLQQCRPNGAVMTAGTLVRYADGPEF